MKGKQKQTTDMVRHRITRDDGESAAVDDFIDEAVIGDAHVEMMNERAAWMRLGAECFWISVEKGKLRIRYSEHREPRP